jgi:hypothetical protein
LPDGIVARLTDKSFSVLFFKKELLLPVLPIIPAAISVDS